MAHVLAGVTLFRGLPDPALDRLLGHAAPFELGGSPAPARQSTLGPPDHHMVFRKDEPADAVYAILGGAGRIQVGVPGDETKRLMVEILGPGDLFGEIGVIDVSVRTADAYAQGPVRLVRIPAAVFLAVLADTPPLGLNLARLLAARLRRTFTLFQDASFESIEVRLARQVVYMMERDGRQTERGIRIPGQLRQGDLADLMGTTNRSIITALNAWRAREWVVYDGDKALLVVLNPTRLRALIAPK